MWDPTVCVLTTISRWDQRPTLARWFPKKGNLGMPASREHRKVPQDLRTAQDQDRWQHVPVVYTELHQHRWRSTERAGHEMTAEEGRLPSHQ